MRLFGGLEGVPFGAGFDGDSLKDLNCRDAPDVRMYMLLWISRGGGKVTDGGWETCCVIQEQDEALATLLFAYESYAHTTLGLVVSERASLSDEFFVGVLRGGRVVPRRTSPWPQYLPRFASREHKYMNMLWPQNSTEGLSDSRGEAKVRRQARGVRDEGVCGKTGRELVEDLPKINGPLQERYHLVGAVRYNAPTLLAL